MKSIQNYNHSEIYLLKLLFIVILGFFVCLKIFQYAEEDDRVKKSFEVNKRIIIGQITDIKESKRIHSSRDRSLHEYTIYPMTYSFDFNGLTYKSEDRYGLLHEEIGLSGSYYKTLKSGSHINIYFDPINPNFNYYEYEEKFINRYTGGTKIYVLFYMISGLFTTLTILYLAFKSDGNPKDYWGNGPYDN